MADRRSVTNLSLNQSWGAALAPPWTVATAADLLWALMNPDTFGRLIQDCRWAKTAYARNLATLLHRTLTISPAPTDEDV